MAIRPLLNPGAYMVNNATGGQDAGNATKLWLSGAMLGSLLVIVAVAAGVLSQGTYSGRPSPPDVTDSPSATSSPSIPASLVGSWVVSSPGADVTLFISPDGRYAISDGDSGGPTEGSIEVVESTLFLDDERYTWSVTPTGAGDELVLAGSAGEIRFTKVD
jgi:hypothetical protein